MGRWWAGIITFSVILALVLPLAVIQPWRREERQAGFEILIKDHLLDDVYLLDLEDYITGVVAAEMGPGAPLEALKAQAIAARTYALYHQGPISTDPASGQAYFSPAMLRERWGAVSYVPYQARIARAVAETRGIVMEFDGQPILAVYHANSGGMTEDSALVWGQSLPYLVSRPSPFGRDHDSWRENLKFSLTDINARLQLSLHSLRELAIEARSTSGRVLAIKAGDLLLCGRQFRTALGLPSTLFNWHMEGDMLYITGQGRGHGVGMSQDGASYLAERGYSCYQILRYYYPGVEFTRYY